MKRHAPATERNRKPIATVLELELPANGTVLEIASGSGEHAVYFAERFPQLIWQPSDCEPEAIASISAYRDEVGLPNLAEPLEFFTVDPQWPIDACDAIFCANMIHISPWASAHGLFHHAGNLLARGAPLILYGPFFEDGTATAASNLAFDQSLKARNPDWGIRHINDVDALAEETGFQRAERYEMPANNLTLVYRRC
ncbi:DUF938 domain-containing protein [Aurantiacibacter sp. D1-12]|uniref:DUF938 domain-containing protein n=1 Tax=Aurantiacibacter sp. D1-12 TaxID=2993658 RepID=UPI00237D03A5|nr:DUF938 domain-containing protein [Aurantiacibacter sp. D1-12]MDE1466332.1 DUF938 domain-containing protein [Aurantiacibacter sp. D1-12]